MAACRPRQALMNTPSVRLRLSSPASSWVQLIVWQPPPPPPPVTYLFLSGFRFWTTGEREERVGRTWDWFSSLLRPPSANAYFRLPLSLIHSVSLSFWGLIFLQQLQSARLSSHTKER